jgi:acid phosphatase (class A)
MRKFVVTTMLVMLSASPALALSNEPYLPKDHIDAIMVVPPPPEPASDQQQIDLDKVLAIQKSRIPAQIKRAQTDRDFTGFATVMGPKFTAENLPLTAAFIRKVTTETNAEVDRVKDCWQRPRPFVFSKDVMPADNALQAMATKPGTMVENNAPHGPGSPCKPAEKTAFSYSYPSGGANVGMTAAVLLSAMRPEKRNELFARAREYGENRLILGVHFPSDVEAAGTLATIMIGFMMSNPAFTDDLAVARAELNKVLGAAVAPDGHVH